MLNELLPRQIDVRKLAVKGADITANFAPAVLPRFLGMLANGEGVIAAELHFYIDDQRKYRIDGKVSADVQAVCQRCLEPVAVSVGSEFSLAIVRSDDQARQLPRTLEPLIVDDELIDLADVVEEELILSLPFVNYHEETHCQNLSEMTFGEEVLPSSNENDNVSEARKDNPFNVLEQLKSSK